MMAMDLHLGCCSWPTVVATAVGVYLLALWIPRLWGALAQYLAFRRVPADRDGEHWLLGHSPKVRLRLYCLVSGID